MTSTTLVRVPTVSVVASPDQNRTEFDPVKLRELADAIASAGLLAPIKVREVVGLDGTTYVLVAGERRLRACRDLLGWSEIDALVSSDPDDLRAALGTLMENMMRDNPPPLDEARGLRDTADKFGLTPSELAQSLGYRPAFVRDRLALLNLADDVAHYVDRKQLSIERAVLMSSLDPNRQRLALQAHQTEMNIASFRKLIERLKLEQASDSMFDTDSFLRVEEYVLEAEAAAMPEPVETAEIRRERVLGVAEIAELLGVKAGTVHQWKKRDLLPPADMTVGGVAAYYEGSIVEWARCTGRLDRREIVSVVTEDEE